MVITNVTKIIPLFYLHCHLNLSVCMSIYEFCIAIFPVQLLFLSVIYIHRFTNLMAFLGGGGGGGEVKVTRSVVL